MGMIEFFFELRTKEEFYEAISSYLDWKFNKFINRVLSCFVISKWLFLNEWITRNSKFSYICSPLIISRNQTIIVNYPISFTVIIIYYPFSILTISFSYPHSWSFRSWFSFTILQLSYLLSFPHNNTIVSV